MTLTTPPPGYCHEGKLDPNVVASVNKGKEENEARRAMIEEAMEKDRIEQEAAAAKAAADRRTEIEQVVRETVGTTQNSDNSSNPSSSPDTPNP